MDETTCLLPTAAADDDDDDDSLSSPVNSNNNARLYNANAFQTESNKYAHGKALVTVRPWSDEMEGGDGDDEKENCQVYRQTSKRSLVLTTACLFLVFLCLFLRLPSFSNPNVKFLGTSRGAFNHKSILQQQQQQQQQQNVVELPSLDDFLQERHEHPTTHFVIGNKAGDADSVVSALALAYIESYEYVMVLVQNANDIDDEKNQKTPIASIVRADLQTQRPDIGLLLQWVGISSNHLTFVDDPWVVETATTNVVDVDVTLTDHNAMDIDMPSWTVVEIVDHHVDQGQHRDTCFGDARLIAFDKKQPLVASTCSLVAERLQRVWSGGGGGGVGARSRNHGDVNHSNGKTRMATATTTISAPPSSLYPASVSLLLLGAILLDSMNLSPQANAATLRDIRAVQDLLEHTNWLGLSVETQIQLGMTGANNKPNTTLIFNKLEDAKYNPDFWKSLSVRDALRLDYKDYTYGDDSAANDGQAAGVFGISSIRIPIEDFLANKQDLVTDIINFMVIDAHIDFLAIMPVFVAVNGQYLKQLVLINRNNDGSATPPPFLNELRLYLLQQESLGLQQIQGDSCNQTTVGLHMDRSSSREQGGDDNYRHAIDDPPPPSPSSSISLLCFNQLKIEPSRKQIGPMLRAFFDNSSQYIESTDDPERS